MKKKTKQQVAAISSMLHGIRNEIEKIAALEREVQNEYPVQSDEFERHGYNVMLLEDSMSFIKDSLDELTESLEYEDIYEE